MTETTSPVLLRPAGRLDATNSAQFEKDMLDRLTQSPRGMVMDFSDLSYISSAGLRVVLLAAKKAKAIGGQFVLCGLSPAISNVFKVSGFLSILTVEPDPDAALAHFG